MSDPVLEVRPLSNRWQTVDPFLFCVHHVDHYPQGNEQFGPAVPLTGHDIGQDFEGVDGCNTGAHVIESDAPFGLWVWGWGNTQTTAAGLATISVSYGYPGGMNVESINDVVVDVPK